MRFTVGGNVAEKLLLANWRHVGNIRTRIRELMEQTELPPERIDDDPHTFSGGMLQRVQIAKALSSSPSLLLLDEVTSGLDLSVQARVLDLIRRVRDRGLSVVLISHNMPHVFQLADRIHIQRLGRRVALADTASITMTDAVAIMTSGESGR